MGQPQPRQPHGTSASGKSVGPRASSLLRSIDRHHWGLTTSLVLAAVALRVLLAAYCPVPFGYVFDYYHEGVELFWETGRLPLASDCWQCYHPPLFYLLGLPFYAIGRVLTAASDSSDEWGQRALCLLPLLAGGTTAFYSIRLVKTLIVSRALTTIGTAIILAFPCLFISSYGPEADVVVAACMTAFMYYLVVWMTSGAAGWRWPVGIGCLAGLAAAAKYSGLIALAVAGFTLGVRVITGPSRARVIRDGIVVLAVATAIGGWKYVDNERRYGTPLFANGSAGDAFSSSRESYADLYDFHSFTPGAVVALTLPGGPKGQLTSLPLYRHVWTTLYAMAWTDMSFFSVPGRMGDSANPYAWKHIPSWLTAAVLYLGLVPTACAVVGALLLVRRRDCLPLHVTLVLTMASYLAWVVAQDDWALKTKYIVFLLPVYVIYALAGLEWMLARVPRWTREALVAAMLGLVVVAHLYDLAFAIGRL